MHEYGYGCVEGRKCKCWMGGGGGGGGCCVFVHA